MGRGSSKAGSSGSNSKYKGFSVTDQNGNKRNFIVKNGKVLNAESGMAGGGGILGLDANSTEIYQRAYEMEGSTSGLIKRINSVGLAKAETLSDKKVVDLQKKYKKRRKETEEQQEKDAYKRKHGANRHRAYWSAM